MRTIFIALLLFSSLIYSQEDVRIFRVTYMGYKDYSDGTTDKIACKYLITVSGNTMQLVMDDETYKWVFYGNINKDGTDFSSKAMDHNGDICEIYFNVTEALDVVIAIGYKKGILLYYCELEK